MEGIGWWEGIHGIPAGVNSTLDCVPQLPNEALGLVWKPGIPPGTRPYPWAGSPRGNRPRAKSSRHLEAHGKGISDPIHQFPTGQPSRPPEAGRRFPVARTRREEKLRLPPPPPSPPPLYHQAPPPLRVRAPPPSALPSLALPPPPLRRSSPRRLQRHHPLGELDLQ